MTLHYFVLVKSTPILQIVILFIVCITTINARLSAQVIPSSVRQQIEAFLEDQEIEDIDIFELYEKLENYVNKPFDLNSEDFETLQELRLLSTIQLFELEQHINTYGSLIDVYELQSIPSFDRETIERIQPFVGVNDADRYQLPLKDIIYQGKHELYLKWRRVLEDQKGYLPNEEGETNYLGDPNRLFLKYKYNYESRFRYGFTLEKDSGEEFFSGSNSKGFDFNSAYVYMKDYSRFLKDIVVGDYTVSLGQGLIAHNAFGSGKSAWSTDIKRGGRVLKPYNSVSENRYFRGVATTVRPIEDIELSVFGSATKRDGGIDTFDFEDQALVITSINESGYHRTASEITREGVLSALSFGSCLKYKKDNYHLGLNFLSQSVNRTLTLDGTNVQNGSFDYSYRVRNLHFFGEAAHFFQTSSWANVHGLLIGLGKKAAMAMLYRNYSPFYGSLDPNGFGESSITQNEKGFYMGLELYPSNKIKVRMYGDLWKNPQPKFRVDRPSTGKEFLLRVDYTKKRRFNVYAQIRYERKDRNYSSAEQELFFPDTKITIIRPSSLYRLRLHFANKLSKAVELRSRVEFSRFEHATKSNGIIVYQDVILRPIDAPFSLSARYAIFSIKDYDARIYTYENDILYEFFIPSFSNANGNGNGTRFYVNLRANITRAITGEFRYAQTYFQNAETISSGNEEIQGDAKTELKAQLRFKF